MARRSDLTKEIAEARMASKEKPDQPRLRAVTDEDGEPRTEEPRGRQVAHTEREARRIEAMSLKMAGLSWEQVGERIGMTSTGVRELVNRGLERASQREVEQMRAMENARLDRAQAAIWSRVLDGDLKAIDSFLRISQRRSKINGMDAPTKIDLSIEVRQEMEQALAGLESLVLGDIVAGEVIRDDSGR